MTLQQTSCCAVHQVLNVISCCFMVHAVHGQRTHMHAQTLQLWSSAWRRCLLWLAAEQRCQCFSDTAVTAAAAFSTA